MCRLAAIKVFASETAMSNYFSLNWASNLIIFLKKREKFPQKDGTENLKIFFRELQYHFLLNITEYIFQFFFLYFYVQNLEAQFDMGLCHWSVWEYRGLTMLHKCGCTPLGSKIFKNFLQLTDHFGPAYVSDRMKTRCLFCWLQVGSSLWEYQLAR